MPQARPLSAAAPPLTSFRIRHAFDRAPPRNPLPTAHAALIFARWCRASLTPYATIYYAMPPPSSRDISQSKRCRLMMMSARRDTAFRTSGTPEFARST
jgi:hypothetical protein